MNQNCIYKVLPPKQNITFAFITIRDSRENYIEYGKKIMKNSPVDDIYTVTCSGGDAISKGFRYIEPTKEDIPDLLNALDKVIWKMATNSGNYYTYYPLYKLLLITIMELQKGNSESLRNDLKQLQINFI